MSRRQHLVVVLALLLLGLAVVTVGSPLVTNTWFLLTEPAYVIPTESSVLTFTPTIMNPGSGDWWLYGEDADYYYHFSGLDPAYVAVPKDEALRCEGFDAVDFGTWCLSR